MQLLDKSGALYRNQAAREQLKLMWHTCYAANLERLLPIFVDDLSQGMVAVGGVQWIPAPAPCVREAAGLDIAQSSPGRRVYFFKVYLPGRWL